MSILYCEIIENRFDTRKAVWDDAFTVKQLTRTKSMTTKLEWTPADVSKARYLGPIEFKDNRGEWHFFEVLHAPVSTNNPARIVFGGNCNVGFLESGFISQADCESVNETLQEMLSDLEVYYNDGPQYVSRIVCNERM